MAEAPAACAFLALVSRPESACAAHAIREVQQKVRAAMDRLRGAGR